MDYNTTGVLILTNDGDFSHFLAHPNHRIPRVYRVVIDKPLEQKDKDLFLKGIYLEGKKGKFDEILFPRKNAFSVVSVTSTEGRNHFVKNMFGALRYNVKELDRVSYAGLTVEDLPPGKWRKLSHNEIQSIYQKYGKK